MQLIFGNAFFYGRLIFKINQSLWISVCSGHFEQMRMELKCFFYWHALWFLFFFQFSISNLQGLVNVFIVLEHDTSRITFLLKMSIVEKPIIISFCILFLATYLSFYPIRMLSFDGLCGNNYQIWVSSKRVFPTTFCVSK